jgi:hypothetical protein
MALSVRGSLYNRSLLFSKRYQYLRKQIISMYLPWKTKRQDLENLPKVGPIVEFRKVSPFKQ